MRVLAVTPTFGGQLRAEMRHSMEALDRAGLDLTWAVLDDNPYPPPDHRNVLHMYRSAQQRALAEDYDALWTVEHDMIIPSTAAQELAQTPGDVAYGVYLFRWGTFVLNAFDYIGDKNIGESLSLNMAKAKAAAAQGIVRVSGCGWGCTWIRRAALKAIELPTSCVENPAYDIVFAQRCIRAGLKLYANFRVLCGHMKGEETLLPFVHGAAILYDSRAWTVGGQLMPLYRSEKRLEIVRVVARQTMNAGVNGDSKRLVKGQEYNLPSAVAHELGRVGYVEIIGDAIP